MLQRINELRELEEIRRRKEELYDKEKELTESITITDLDLIPVICDWIEELSDKDSPEVIRYELRQYNVLLCCFLYSPTSILGDPIKRGVRDEIASHINLSSARISNILQTVREWYVVYRDFHYHANYLYGEIFSRLHKYNMIGGKSEN